MNPRSRQSRRESANFIRIDSLILTAPSVPITPRPICRPLRNRCAPRNSPAFGNQSSSQLTSLVHIKKDCSKSLFNVTFWTTPSFLWINEQLDHKNGRARKEGDLHKAGSAQRKKNRCDKAGESGPERGGRFQNGRKDHHRQRDIRHIVEEGADVYIFNFFPDDRQGQDADQIRDTGHDEDIKIHFTHGHSPSREKDKRPIRQ